MQRQNATVPKWDADNLIWTYRPSIDGVQKKYVSRKPGKAGAQECIRKHNAALAGADASRMRLGDEWEKFLVDCAGRLGRQSDGYRKAECFGRLNILPVLKHKRVEKITSHDWQHILNTAVKVDGQPLTKKSLKNIRGVITAFCKYAVKKEIVVRMPFDLTIPLTALTIGKNILQPNDATTLLTDAPEYWEHYMWQLQLVTGLRPGEACGLHRADVKDGLIIVRRAVNSRNQITTGKNDTARRTLVQSEQAAEIIAKQIALLDKNGLGLPWLFPDPNGSMIKPMTAADHWKEYSAKFSVHVTQYCLRHTYVSLVENEMSDAMLKDTVGHSKSMDTHGVYGHKVDGRAEQAAKIISGVFGKLTGTSINPVPGQKENTPETTLRGVSSGAVNGT